MDPTRNPFPAGDPDRHTIWTMLVERDIDAFVAADWSMVAGDFVADGFLGIDAQRSEQPDSWRISFPSVDAYRAEWLRQAQATQATAYAEPVRAAIFRATTLRDIEIADGAAVARKKFDGTIRRADGGADLLRWQTLYFCRRIGGAWRISGFVGYLPHPMGGQRRVPPVTVRGARRRGR